MSDVRNFKITVGYTLDNHYCLTQDEARQRVDGKTVGFVRRTPQAAAPWAAQTQTVTGDPAVVNGTSDWAYDLVGNRLSQTSDISSVLNASETYSANNWLDSHTYDANGNTTQSAISNQPLAILNDTYDWRNRLVRCDEARQREDGETEGFVRRTLKRVPFGQSEAQQADGTIIEIVYDGFGDRVQKTIRNSSFVILNSTWFLVDRNNLTGYAQVVEEQSQGGGVDVIYSYGLDLISQDRRDDDGSGNFTQSFYLYDGLGTVRALTDDTGVVTDTYTYDAWGVEVASTGTTVNAFRFTGEQWDSDLEMYFLRARYLNVATGRFHTMDTFEGVSTDPVTLHKYLYANANPVYYIDPSGLFSLGELTAALQASQTIGNTARVQIGRKGVKKATKTLTCKVGVSFAKKQFVGDGLQGHHAIPKSLGGDPKQALVFLPADTHRTFHWILNVVLKSESGFSGKGNWTSAKNWESISQTKAGREALYRAILESSRIVDKFCKLKGKNSLRSFVKKNRKQFLNEF